MRRPARVIAASLVLALAGLLALPTAASAALPDFEFVPGSLEEPYDYIRYNGVDYVAAFDGGLGVDALYSFDGTTFVNETQATSTLDAMENFVVYDNEIFMAGDDGADWNLWSWNSSGSTFTRITGLTPAPGGVSELVVYDGDLYFSAENGLGDLVLWRWDGTDFTEVIGVGAAPPIDIAFLTVYNGLLTMLGSDGVDDLLYVYDSVADAFSLATGSGTAPDCPTGLTVFNGVLAFDACNSGSPELMTWNGTAFTVVSGGTPPVESYLVAGSAQQGGRLFFSGNNGTDLLPYVFTGTSASPLGPGASVIPGVVTTYAPIGTDVVFAGVNASSDLVFFRYRNGTLTQLTGPEPAGAFAAVIAGSLYVVADDGTNFGMWRYLPAKALPATGIDGLPLLAIGLLLALAGAGLVTRRPGAAATSA